jgi:hypothetical protein
MRWGCCSAAGSPAPSARTRRRWPGIRRRTRSARAAWPAQSRPSARARARPSCRPPSHPRWPAPARSSSVRWLHPPAHARLVRLRLAEVQLLPQRIDGPLAVVPVAQTLVDVEQTVQVTDLRLCRQHAHMGIEGQQRYRAGPGQPTKSPIHIMKVFWATQEAIRKPLGGTSKPSTSQRRRGEAWVNTPSATNTGYSANT